MKVCIAGDRNCIDMSFLLAAIKASGFKITEVVCGDAKGADKLGKEWGKAQGLFVKSFPAKWKDLSYPDAVIKENEYGKYDAKAGTRRNTEMAEYADCFIILQPDGDTPGSSDMRKQAEALGKPVYVHRKTTSSPASYQYHF